MDADQFFDALALCRNTRTATFDDIEITDVEGGFRLEGLAGVYDEVADLGEIEGVGRVTESIQRGAFRKVLALPKNVPLTVEHDEQKVLATTESGTLKLSEEPQGLRVVADLPNTTLSRDVRELVRTGINRGMSFGFKLGTRANQKIERRSNGYHRTLLGFKELLDVTTTWNPTYRSAAAEFRSLATKYADSPESLQQLFQGAYPQLGSSRADDTDDTNEEPAPAGEEPTPDEENERLPREGELSGVVEHRSIAARKRALSFLVLTTGGIDHET